MKYPPLRMCELTFDSWYTTRGAESRQAVWRTQTQRMESAKERLELAKRLWGWEPHAAQGRLLRSPASTRIAACGRRWGKTEALSVDVATLALAEHDSRQMIVAPTDVQARLLGEAVEKRLRDAFETGDEALADLNWKVQRRPYLLLTVFRRDGTGPEATVGCRTAGRDGRSLRGTWAHRIIVDEAARVPDAVLQDVLPPMLADKGGEYVLASSPNGRRAAFYRLFALGEAASGQTGEGLTYASFQCATTDNGAHLDEAFLEAQKDEMGEAMYAQEYLAQFVDDFGAVFRDEDIDAALQTIEGVRVDRAGISGEVQPSHPCIMGIDWGRKWDYTVVAILDAHTMPLRLVHLSRWQGTSWQAQAAVIAALIVRYRPRRVLADGSSIGDPIAEMLTAEVGRQTPGGRSRATVERFVFGAESKQALVDRLNVGLSARALALPPFPTLVRELRGFEYAPGEGRLKTGARAGGHDDCVIALALAYFAAPDPARSPPPGLGIWLGSQM